VLANADYVIMGAGIPMEVPGILDSLAKNEDTKLVIDVDGSGDVVHHAYFSPKTFWCVALWFMRERCGHVITSEG